MSGVRRADQSHRSRRLPRRANIPESPLSSSRPTRSTATAAVTTRASTLHANNDADDDDDDEDSDDDSPFHRRRKRPAHPGTPIKRPFVEADDDIVSTPQTKRLRRSPRDSKSNISYAEPDSDVDLENGSDLDGDEDDNDDDDDVFRPKLKVVNTPSRRKNTRSNRPVANVREKPKPSPRKTKVKKQEQIDDPPSHQCCLSYPGDELPYLVWLRIFEYLASPLLDLDTRLEEVASTVRELLQVASLGKIVYEPAMAALYKQPPISDQTSFRLLSRTLRQPPSTTMIQYRPKVKVLRIDVNDILSFKLNHTYSVLDNIVPYLPRLVDVELYHFLDRPPYRSLDAHVRYKYPRNLLEVLHLASDTDNEAPSPVPIALRSWRWNARLASDAFPLSQLAMIHRTPNFAGLRKVAFVNYQSLSSRHPAARPQIDEEMMDAPAISDLAAAIKSLPQLEHLVFESTTLVKYSLLPLLPKGLKHLELINCPDVEANSFAEFLHTHGNSLERLTLKHCFSLSLSFLRVLSVACPNLIDLHVNLHYYRTHEHYSDADPVWEHIIEHDEVPQWPSSLQSIEINYMKFENVATAEMFFKSLVASAPTLLNLRRLILGAKLNVSYRERSEFRQTLETKIGNVFQRRSQSPRSVRSLKAGGPRVSWHRQHSLEDEPLRSSVERNSGRTRRRTRGAAQSLPPTPPCDEGSSVAPKHKLASQLQWSMRDIPTRKSPVADDDSGDEELAARYCGLLKLDGDDDFVQGLCDVVQVELDNQKPVEHKWSMADFLDSPSGEDSDEDWNGDDSD